MKRQLLVEVECGENDCGACELSRMVRGVRVCSAFDDTRIEAGVVQGRNVLLRVRPCLAAEKKAKGGSHG